MPKISIVIPAYNCEKYLKEAVGSVLAQTWQDWELLILDDCSKDATFSEMQKLAEKDERIRIFQNPCNMGAAATRNRGVALAAGEWIAFLDGDDLWAPEKLEKQMAVLERIPDAGFLFTGSAFIEDDGMTIAYVLHIPEKVNRKKLLGQNVISCSSVLIRREYMMEFPMPEQDGIHEDFAAWLSVLSKVPWAYGVDEPLLIYRRAFASKSGKKQKSALMNWQTYAQAGIPVMPRLCHMISYTFHGLIKYSLLWWRSYRLMMGKERFKRLFLFLMNALMVLMWTGAFAYAWFHFYNFRNVIGRRYAFWGYVALLTLYGTLNILVGKVFSAFRVIHQQFLEVILSHAYTSLIVNAATYLELALIGRWTFGQYIGPIIAVAAFNFVFALLWSVVIRRVYASIYPPHEVILIYGEKSMHSLEKEMERQYKRYSLSAQISLKEGREKIAREILKHETVMLGDMPAEDREFFIKYCFAHQKRCYCQTSLADIMLMSSEKIYLSDMTIQLFRNCGLTVEQRLMKRMFDLLFSVGVCILFAPVYVLIALYIRLYDGGPILVSRECLTRKGKHFYQYKFRTHRKDGDGWIRGGHFLEASHLDELPQFINILRGDMSVVGPYPEMVNQAEEYEKINPEFAYRLMVKAGLTGYAKVHGKYSISRMNQLKMDLYYIQNYSFGMDLNIIAATAKVLLEPQRK
ncbi:MAG: sugar transferase [Lachnospiraceae bacterium]|nr:sugar transferase [Lachnospiraceae bacterium]